MKEFLKKYIGIILSSIMIVLLVLSYFLYPNHPKISHIFVDIIAWYIAGLFGLVIMYFEFKFLIWYEKQIDKFKKWVIKK
jgi:hypothetical protein